MERQRFGAPDRARRPPHPPPVTTALPRPQTKISSYAPTPFATRSKRNEEFAYTYWRATTKMKLSSEYIFHALVIDLAIAPGPPECTGPSRGKASFRCLIPLGATATSTTTRESLDRDGGEREGAGWLAPPSSCIRYSSSLNWFSVPSLSPPPCPSAPRGAIPSGLVQAKLPRCFLPCSSSSTPLAKTTLLLSRSPVRRPRTRSRQ